MPACQGGGGAAPALNKKPTSGKMSDQQMEFTTKLAEFEEVYEEPEKLEAGASFLDTMPKPAWLSDPTSQPHWSIAEARLAGAGGPVRNALAVPGLARLEAPPKPKIADALNGMIISMHPTLLHAECMSSLGAAAAAGGARVRLRPDPAPAAPTSLVAFHRAHDVTRLQPVEQSVCLSSEAGCLRYLSVVPCSAAVQLVASRALARHAAALLRARPGRLTILIHDATNYFKRGKPREDLEEAKIELQLSLGVDTLVCGGAEQLAAHVLRAARALQEEPYKLGRRAVDEEAQFYMRGDSRQGVAVDAQGNGLGRLWQQMLSVLPQSSLEVSRALAAHCPTPRHMAQTAALSSVPVARSAAPGARARRLGPDLANKLSNVFNQHGDFKLD